MRNLSLASIKTIPLGPSANLCCTTIDLDQNALYAASERVTPDGEVGVELWKIEGDSEIESDPQLFSMFSTMASAQDLSCSQVISLKAIPDCQGLVVITRGGDITMVSLESEEPMPEVQGSVEDGILAASWSPDDSLLALVTGVGKLILMTSTFDVLSEAPIDTLDFGEDAPINVGWGSKQTQFHGSLGKTAAQAPSNILVGSSPDDDHLPRIHWRGDGAYFVVSSLTPEAAGRVHRILRVYDRQGALQSTSEAVSGLEHSLSWRPSGNLIASTQRFGFEGGGAGRAGRHDLVFFERNGLRHGEFELRPADMAVGQSADKKWGYRVKEVGWSSDSNVLSIWIERDEGDLVQLWTIGNYHWYLKQEISASSKSSKPVHFTSVEWHPEKALQMILTTSSEVIYRSFAWETTISPSKPPIDSGLVSVADGAKLLLTPFRTQNVPPPMSSLELSLASSVTRLLPSASRIPVSTCFTVKSDSLGILWEEGSLEIWSLHTRLGAGRGKVLDPQVIYSGNITDPEHAREVTFRQMQLLDKSERGNISAVLLGSGSQGKDVLVISTFDGEKIVETTSLDMQSLNGRLLGSDSENDNTVIAWQGPKGDIFEVDPASGVIAPINRFSELCFVAQQISSINNPSIYVGLADNGKLYVTAQGKSCRTLATNATSFTVASGYLIYTTGTHEVIFSPLKALPDLLIVDDHGSLKDIPTDWEKRRVERGSRIVVSVPSAMSLVLQMPRGNLETINPRPLVLEVVRQDLDAGQYRKAFLSCRKHRIDLNFLVEHDQTGFLENLSAFVEQVHEVDHINLFLTNVGRGSQPPETITKICDTLREELEKRDLKTYVNSILTAHVVKTPPDHESGLSLLLRLRETEPTLVEDAVKYIIFLVDADKLFDTALGMYDFSLVLLIAQHSQKDPREYLPFLRELRALDKYHQRFRIDDHLKRHVSALQNLSLAGPSYFDEAIEYVERYQLYDSALSIWKGTPQYKSILDVYGTWLFERKEFRQAASVFVEAENTQKAIISYERSLDWQDLFDLALRLETPQEDIVEIGYRVSEELTSKKRYSEAARVLLDYVKDVRTAVITLVQGNEFSEARRIITLNHVPELLEDVIHPGALESRAQISEDLSEMKEQIRKQLNRIRELRVKKVEDPDEFYGVEDTALHDVDVMTDVSMAPTAFTRYTVAPSTASRMSKRSSRSKRKMERKVGSGRKGTVDEEEYLLKSVSKLVGRFSATRDEGSKLLPHLLQFTPEHRDEGLAMQRELADFETELKAAVEEIWAVTPPLGDGSINSTENAPTRDSWAARMEEAEKNRRINPVERVPKPEMSGDRGDWKLRLFEFLGQS
ncbi:pol II transcription elongation factor [Dendrothele bispora CBS 962.96]|uniref:Elongator complex protein 1 n=1 Tax=Dendrothele bispora (strain CBS 962.96) TaxID=1314807 RepID=A0A4S8MUK9_DENBC|nr:pol II transcription elongation factor [Dendrothele bispora CBS 962.96]